MRVMPLILLLGFFLSGNLIAQDTLATNDSTLRDTSVVKPGRNMVTYWYNLYGESNPLVIPVIMIFIDLAI